MTADAVAARPHRRVWRLAGPIILSNLSVPLLGAVDTAVMGHQPDAAFVGAVAVGALIFSIVYWGFGFLRMGTTGFTAQADGAGDDAELRAALARPILLASAIAAAILLLQWPIAELAFALIGPSEAVESLGRIYFDIRIWGAPATLMTYALLGWLLGVSRARDVLLLTVALNGVNIALTLFLVLELDWGIAGAAWGTVIAEYLALVLGFGLVRSELTRRGGSWDRDRILDRPRLAALFRVNFDIFVRTLCLEAAFAVFLSISAKFGDTRLAGNAILQQLQTFLAFGLDGFAHAAEVLAGSAFGARNRSVFRKMVEVSTLWAVALSVVVTGVYFLFGETIISLFTDLPEVRAAALTYLPWLAISPLVSVWSYQLDGIFIGATRTGAMRNAMIASLLAFLAAAALLVPLLENHGLWLAFLIFMAARAVTLGAYYPRLEREVETRV